MGNFGLGYGSECHLLRYLGRHRRVFDLRVLGATGHGRSIDWLDFDFAPNATPMQDAELTGLDFLAPAPAFRAAWAKFWPQTGKAMNWDAVGWLRGDGPPELVLVEAKAHLGELASSTGATGSGRALIEASLLQVSQALGSSAGANWSTGYYQAANRVAALWFLLQYGVSARLLNVYFVGDHGNAGSGGRICPADDAGWKQALDAQSKHLGLPPGHPLESRIHSLYLPVAG